MSLHVLHALHQLLGQHLQQAQQPQQLQAHSQYVAPLANYGDGLGSFAVGGSNAAPPQGGQYNPGATPLQGSNTQLGQNPQFQGYNAGQGIQARGHFNPQVKDRGFTWNNY